MNKLKSLVVAALAVVIMAGTGFAQDSGMLAIPESSVRTAAEDAAAAAPQGDGGCEAATAPTASVPASVSVTVNNNHPVRHTERVYVADDAERRARAAGDADNSAKAQKAFDLAASAKQTGLSAHTLAGRALTAAQAAQSTGNAAMGAAKTAQTTANQAHALATTANEKSDDNTTVISIICIVLIVALLAYRFRR